MVFTTEQKTLLELMAIEEQKKLRREAKNLEKYITIHISLKELREVKLKEINKKLSIIESILIQL